IGGVTGARFFHPAHPDQEGVDQVVRNNFIADCDDAVFEIRGALRARIYHNTVVTQTRFAIFRFQTGNSAADVPSGNDEIEIANNLIVSAGGDPQYARNDAGEGAFVFRSQLWAGPFHNSGATGPAMPRFPLATDTVVSNHALAPVLARATFDGLSGLADAFERYRPAVGSPAVRAGAANSVAIVDAGGRARDVARPSIGALEPDSRSHD
ncbi:MAG TPA: hypothetical protein VD788_05670, partial [Candidatus Polarisedimenticolaceae bacterium]|nr:hypothetical protein [Candidatus Polarisedimenticolaceae bacterium]